MRRGSAPAIPCPASRAVRDRAPNEDEQIPALAERGRARINRFFAYLDRRLAATPFVAKDRYTIADITAFITVEFAKWAKLPVPPSCPQLAGLQTNRRSSAKA